MAESGFRFGVIRPASLPGGEKSGDKDAGEIKSSLR